MDEKVISENEGEIVEMKLFFQIISNFVLNFICKKKKKKNKKKKTIALTMILLIYIYKPPSNTGQIITYSI